MSPSVFQHETIEQLLERGEKLDDLVQKTDKLSGTSKAFYKEVKRDLFTFLYCKTCIVSLYVMTFT